MEKIPSGEHMVSVQKETGPAPKRQPDFGVSGTEQKRQLEEQIFELQNRRDKYVTGGIAAEDLSAEMKAELVEIDYALQEKELEMKVFLQEHDNAGAFKMKRFNEGFMNLFEQGQLNISKSGNLELDKSEANRRLAVINVGELARFNKEGGGHKAGDQILTEALHVIEQRVVAQLKAMGQADVPYNIYRYSGNEYMVDIQDISREEMQRLTDDLSHQRPTIEGVEEPAPLAVSSTGFSEMVSIYNQSWQRFVEEEGGADQVAVPAEKTIRRDAYGIMQDIANYGLDVEKFALRTSRVQDIIDRHGIDGEETKKFFNNYMKKMFADSSLQNLEDFVGKSDREVYDLAFEWASKMLGQTEEREEMLDEIAETFSRRILERRQKVEPPEKFVYASGEEVPLAEIPQQTRGQEELVKAQSKEDDAEKIFKKDRHGHLAKHDYEMAKLENRLVKARRDQGTGLLERGVYYDELAEALGDKDKETSVLFIDMGFLKYFDQSGGRDVGDNALKLAADLMERAVEQLGLEATVYRYGGDEFTVRIDGGPDEVAQFNAQLYELTKTAGAVPIGKRGHEGGYYPTPLEFNYGVADSSRLEEALDQLEEAGLLAEGRREDPKIRAEILTEIADKMIETQKAVRRFDMLIKQLEDDRYWSKDGNEDYKQHVDKLIEFSDKGILGERGGRDQLMSWAEQTRHGVSRNELRQEIMSWVGEQITEAQKDSGEKHSTEDMIIEQMVREAYRSQLEQATVQAEAVEAKRLKAEEDQRAAEQARGAIEEL